MKSMNDIIDDVARMLESLVVWEINGKVIVFTSTEELEKYAEEIEI